MQRNRLLLAGVVLVLTSACAGNAPPPAEPPRGEPRVIGEPIEPRPEAPAEPSLEERWRAPFAVLSSGRPAERPAPAQVVVDTRDLLAPTAGVLAVDGPPGAAAGSGSASAEPEAAPQPTQPRPSAAPTPAASAAPSRAASAAPASSTAAGTRTHRVEWGETWFAIARRYEIPSAALQAANPGVVPERIRTGQVLRIPGADPARRPGQRSHTVGPGDSLWGIARRYGVSMERIRAANRLPDDQVRLGQTLIIPASETTR